MQSAPGKIDLGMVTPIAEGFFDGGYGFRHRQEAFDFVWSKYQHVFPNLAPEQLSASST